jgi:hypothetical protein
MFYWKKKSKLKIQNQENKHFPEALSLILCSLLTLAPNENLFKDLDIKKKVYVSTSDKDYLLDDSKKFIELSNLINKSSIRRLAYTILRSHSIKNDKRWLRISPNKQLFSQPTLLKKYLQKFKYTYYRYFFSLAEKPYISTNPKEINTLAIKSLFFLIGV